MNPVRKSLAYTFAEAYIGAALQLVATFYLVRLLTPAEMSVWAVAAVFAAIAGMFRDFGVAEYLIQEKDLTSQKLHAAFAVNIIVAYLMAIALLAASRYIGTFYSESGVTQVIRVQALTFFLVPFGVVTIAYFRRSLNYRPLLLGVDARQRCQYD